jgi:glutamyl-tRNA synthetase
MAAIEATEVRTRFAPSPTGFLHIGGGRTALFAWAYARRHKGKFILRIEDTDVERSTPEAVEAILDGMKWLGLDYDEGPFFQMQRMDRYKQAIQFMLTAGTAYYCYTTSEELDAMREAQREAGEKPRYDGRWRPERGKPLPAIPAGQSPVVRFRNPETGTVAWDDKVKGRIEISNEELDDFIIARADGTPTYNFCVCVDDWDMRITHVIRGDDHVNNTPRQINVLKALGADLPVYAHVSMILGDDGQKLSKRHGAVSVMQYPADGYLRDAVVNYLARLGWSHAELGEMLQPFLISAGLDLANGPDVVKVAELLKERCATLVEMAEAAHYFYHRPAMNQELLTQYLTDSAKPALAELKGALQATNWVKADIGAAVKAQVAKHGLKMPQIMMPLRVLLTGQTQTPAIDAIMETLGLDETLARFHV